MVEPPSSSPNRMNSSVSKRLFLIFFLRENMRRFRSVIKLAARALNIVLNLSRWWLSSEPRRPFQKFRLARKTVGLFPGLGSLH